MTDTRVVFDFDITFSNGGSLEGRDFRLDIDGDSIEDEELADLIVADLDLLMVGSVEISSKRYVSESHKRAHAGWSFADLSHPIRHGEVTYPGLPAPEIRTLLSREESRTRYEEGTEFDIGAIDMAANTGTYVDAPFHRYADGADLAGLPLERLVGVPGLVVDAGERVIGPEVFDGVRVGGKAVLIRTGWDTRFGGDDYLGEHPYLTAEAASVLADGGVLVVGIDSANIDDTAGGARPAHSILLAAGITLVEHLAHLERLPGGPFELFVIPAPVVGMGTFPVRAVARWRSG
jgi:kynurenine formamidase